MNEPVKTSAKLSVLVPFYRDDPEATLRAVAGLVGPELSDTVEVVAWDDGTGDAAMTARLRALEHSYPVLRVLGSDRNRGRSSARNALVAAARGEWLLFLDADMRPGDALFLGRYLESIERAEAEVVFGGFSVPPTSHRDVALHRRLSVASDCHDAARRAALGPQHVASSNLLVRRDVLATEAFDPGFAGWGWEDSEWAARVAGRYTLLHIDNPAVHLGLETTETLLRRFATSGGNYLRFAHAHPEFVHGLPLWRHSARLARVPGQRLARPFLRLLVRAPVPVPMAVRVAALKLWRASHYADHMPRGHAPAEATA